MRASAIAPDRQKPHGRLEGTENPVSWHSKQVPGGNMTSIGRPGFRQLKHRLSGARETVRWPGHWQISLAWARSATMARSRASSISSCCPGLIYVVAAFAVACALADQ